VVRVVGERRAAVTTQAKKIKDNKRLRKKIVVIHEKRAARRAEYLCAVLEPEHDCFMAPRDVAPGVEWRSEIEFRIRQADLVLVLITDGFEGGRGFRHYEVKLALEVAAQKPIGAVFLVPVWADENASMPEELQKFEPIKLFKKGAYVRLLEDLRRIPVSSPRFELIKSQTASNSPSFVYSRDQNRGVWTIVRSGLVATVIQDSRCGNLYHVILLCQRTGEVLHLSQEKDEEPALMACVATLNHLEARLIRQSA